MEAAEALQQSLAASYPAERQEQLDASIAISLEVLNREPLSPQDSSFGQLTLILAAGAPDADLESWGGRAGLLAELSAFWESAPTLDQRGFDYERTIHWAAEQLFGHGRPEAAGEVLSAARSLKLTERGHGLLDALRLQVWAVLEQVDSALNRIETQRGDWLRRSDALLAQSGKSESSDLAPESAELSRLCIAVGDTYLRLGLLDEVSDWAGRALQHAEAAGDLRSLVNAALHLSDLELFREEGEAVLYELDVLAERPGYEAGLAQDPSLETLLDLRRGFALARLEASGDRSGDDSVPILEELLATKSPRVPENQVRRFLLDRLALSDGAEARRRGEELISSFRSAPASPDLVGRIEDVVSVARFERRHGLGSADERLARLQPVLDETLEAWRAAPRRRGGLGFLHLVARRRLLCESMRAMVTSAGAAGERRALHLLLEVSAAGVLTQDLGLATPSPEDFQKALAERESGSLIFVEDLDALLILAVDSQGITLFERPPKWEVKEERKRWLELLYRDPPANAAERDSRARLLRSGSESVSDWLFSEPLRERIKGWRGIIVHGGAMGEELALEALPLRPDEPMLLGESHAIESSAALAHSYLGLVRAGEPRPDAAQKALVAGILNPPSRDKVRGKQLSAVPEALESSTLEGLQESLAWAETRLLSGPGTSWSAIRAGIEAHSPVRLLHILAHGAYERTRERAACLLLGADELRPDGVVFAEDIEAAPLAVELVVLSACGAARGNQRIGDSALAHLGGAFLRAGVGGVVLSRANLELEATARLFEDFQRGLGAGLNAGEALRRARARTKSDDLSRFHAARVVLLGSERALAEAPR